MDWNILLTSPVAIALISVLGVKLADIFAERSKRADGDRTDTQGKLWERVDKMEEDRRKSDALTDSLVLQNAQLTARVGTLEAANAGYLRDLQDVTQQRNELRKKLDEALIRIGLLETQVCELEGKAKE